MTISDRDETVRLVRAAPMMARRTKATFYVVAGPLMRLNAGRHRLFSMERGGVIRAHLGPGKAKYLDGWVNVDANAFTARCDIWADLRNPLPFRDNAVDAFYSHHVIEHLPNLQLHFDELYRCLKPGGVFRIGGPNGDSAIQKFISGDAGWFSDYPDKRTSIGGRFENFIFCRQEHLTILTLSYLKELAGRSGFRDLAQRRPIEETGFPDVFDKIVLDTESETTPEFPHTLIVEGRKPNREDAE
ncbi:MAG TPA: methyltransferase domain-containing protein [Bradyrhizobium sp.]|nr:methyltransferase domain-containing protein [Bradyrhizobium sp.]